MDMRSERAREPMGEPTAWLKIFETEPEKYRGKYNMWNMDQKEQIKEGGKNKNRLCHPAPPLTDSLVLSDLTSTLPSHLLDRSSFCLLRRAPVS
jgi:hypothetical protein